MGNSYYNVVATVLLVMNFERMRSLQDLCGSCMAGTFCGVSTDRTCTPCPLGSYTNTSGQRACKICRQCAGYFSTKKPCSPTSNAECKCVPGFHCLGPECSMCEQDCKQGQQLTEDGCKDCQFGTFNDQENGSCQPWRDCSLAGKSVLMNGTKDRDVVCGPTLAVLPPSVSSVTISTTERDPGHSSQILAVCLALMLATVSFLLFFLVLRLSVLNWSRKEFLYMFKQPFVTPVQTAQEEDGCSCRFPEEEEGGFEL